MISTVSAQGANLTVRLYSLHPERRVQLTARTGTLKWKTCERCPFKQSERLIVEAGTAGLSIEDLAVTQQANEILVEGDYRIEPSEGFKLNLTFPLRIKNGHTRLTLLLSVPLEDYVVAALAGESGSFEHAESMKAMAVAVRTYALRFKSRHAANGFDFCDNTHCQTLNFKGITPQARAAAVATRGELLWYDSKLAATFYHQNCGGSVAAAGEAWPDLRAPYLPKHEDPYCVRGAPLPWKAQLDRDRLRKALRDQGLKVPDGWRQLEIVARAPSGRAQKLAFRGAAGAEQMISASALRFAIGRTFGWNEVRSDLYEIENTSGSVIFSGRGSGHGVGLCQAGAEEMAREGKSYREILAFYYPGAPLGLSAAAGLQWQRKSGQRVELLSTQPEQESGVLAAAEGILPELEADLGWRLDSRPQSIKPTIKVYPSLDAYRNSTGQPGWVAAFTRGQTISLQPLAVLRDKAILESTLRHELTHLLIEARAHPGTPLWFREGLVLYFTESRNSAPAAMTEAEMEEALRHPEDRLSIERAYAAARTRVAKMIEQNGKEMVLGWLRRGILR
ncbi:MAG TPA: SpoIID/LytB domain-containing protein [Candidatus Saccharimonadales bacterium]|nr:SpoIID/LytB domain-containing protein [Candidatus Saccharimonadales bacterium]